MTEQEMAKEAVAAAPAETKMYAPEDIAGAILISKMDRPHPMAKAWADEILANQSEKLIDGMTRSMYRSGYLMWQVGDRKYKTSSLGEKVVAASITQKKYEEGNDNAK